MELTPNSDPQKSIKLNLDDFDIESFEVKPLNKGLGFHKNEERVRPKKSNVVPVAAKPVSEVRQLLQRSEPLPRLFSEEVKAPTERVPEAAPTLKTAKAYARGVAYLLDLAIISAIFSGLVLIFLVSAGYKIEVTSLNRLLENTGVIITLGLFFSLIYLLYFSLLDMHASFGKEALGLRVEGTREKRLTISQSFMRSVLSLISYLALGLPMILDLHSKLSDSMVIEQ
jgi:uncharacterized RDD family membrane protein YckC